MILALTGLISACSPFQKRELVGTWKGTVLLEEGDSLAINPEIIQFAFKSKGTYTFESTLKYKESGTFRLDAHLLYTQDTSRPNASEKAVEILLLSRDSMHLRMMEQGKERVLKLAKERR